MSSSSSSQRNPADLERKRRRVQELVARVEQRRGLIVAPSSASVDMTKVQGILGGPRLTWDWGDRKQGGENEEEEGLIVSCDQNSRSALQTHIDRAKSSSQVTFTKPDLEAIKESKRRSFLVKKSADVVVENNETQPVLNMGISQNFTQEFVVEEEIEMEPPSDVSETQVFVHATATQIFTDKLINPTSAVQREDSATPDIVIETTEDIDTFLMSRERTTMERRAERTTIERPTERSTEPSELPTERDDVVVEDDDSDGSVSSAAPKMKSRKRQLEFEEWLAERKRLKLKQRQIQKKRGAGSSEFIEAEAEESEDEDLGNILRGSKVNESDEDSEGSSEEDLDDLVASEAEEFLVQRKQRSKRVARLHAKWAAEQDEALERAIADKDFARRSKKRPAGFDQEDPGGLSRLQRKRKALRDAYVQQFDQEGNLLAPELEDDSEDYDSMDINSDDFFTEDDEEEASDAEHLTVEEKAARAAKKSKDLERRKRDAAFKAEMQKRRLALKEKLREEKLQREKDKREIQAGLNLLAAEDRESFKMVTRLPGGSQAPTTASTPAEDGGRGFAFLGSTSTLVSRPRRSSIGSLELE